MTLPYLHQSAALLTQHGKERILGPLLGERLGCRVQHVTGFDTDLLGTFTRDRPREGSQLDAARAKARQGMTLSGLPIGLASEGAFVPDPQVGLIPWNIEIVVWIDDTRALEVVGMAQGPADEVQRLLGTVEELESLVAQVGFPDHGLVLRPQGPDDPRVVKGLDTWDSLVSAFRSALEQADNGRVFVESDLRAHRNPARQVLIRQAGEDLVQRLLSTCPGCGSPGYSRHGAVPGLPCRDCGAPTRKPAAEVWCCPACGRNDHRPVAHNARADPAHCDRCNP